MQLEDWNHAMLRGIYAVHLILCALAVFLVGFLLIPVSYGCILYIKLRLIIQSCRIRSTRQSIQATQIISHSKFRRRISQFCFSLSQELFSSL